MRRENPIFLKGRGGEGEYWRKTPRGFNLSSGNLIYKGFLNHLEEGLFGAFLFRNKEENRASFPQFWNEKKDDT